MTCTAARLLEEAVYVAYHLHWSLAEILDLDHATRRSVVDEISRINRRINDEA